MSTLPFYGEALARLFFPGLCAFCRELLELEEKGLCRICQGPLVKLRLPPSEERIRIRLSRVDEAWTLFRYEDAVKEIIHKIKFGKRRDLLHLFNEDLDQFLSRDNRFAGYDCMVPIPLDSSRRMEREFNQSGLLASKISRILKIKVEQKGLGKKRRTPAQSLLGRGGRKLNMEKAFYVPCPKKVRERAILIVDDVFTTGATLEEAAKTLKAAGASQIGFFALARTFPH